MASGPNIHLNHTLDAVGMSVAGPSGSFSTLTDFLSRQLGRPVIDKTGLRGLFDFRLEWSVNATALSLGLPAGSVEADNPSLFTALEEQLGLQLESAKGPVQVLVVDRAEKPSRLQIAARSPKG